LFAWIENERERNAKLSYSSLEQYIIEDTEWVVAPAFNLQVVESREEEKRDNNGMNDTHHDP
jgi:hypothetical protein